MAVIQDIIDGGDATRTYEYEEYTRTFIVSELTGSGYAMLQEALNTTGIPQYGDEHPSVDDAYCVETRARTIGPNIAEVSAIYRKSLYNQNYEASLSADSLEKESYSAYSVSTQDSTLYPNTIQYKYPDNYPNPDFAGKESQPQNVRDIIYEPKPQLQIVRFEWTTLYADVLAGYARGVPLSSVNVYHLFAERQWNFVGSLNQSNWTLMPNHPAGTWLCTNISVQMHKEYGLNAQKVFRVVYNFQMDKSGLWQRYIAYTDPNTGEIPSDVSTTPYEGNKVSAKYIRPAIYQNFNYLELS